MGLLAPTSSILPLNQVMNEHRLYLPGIGVALAVAGWVRPWLTRRAARCGVRRRRCLSASGATIWMLLTAYGSSVEVRLAQDDAHVIGRVRDTGIGIAAQDIPHVFDEFFRASNARQVSPHGSGVGLATVRLILENWRGRIWAESEPGRASTFTFTLPRAQV